MQMLQELRSKMQNKPTAKQETMRIALLKKGTMDGRAKRESMAGAGIMFATVGSESEETLSMRTNAEADLEDDRRHVEENS